MQLNKYKKQLNKYRVPSSDYLTVTGHSKIFWQLCGLGLLNTWLVNVE